MMHDWIQIFRIGNYEGKLPIAPADLDAMVRNYDPTRHEAPLVLGHPDSDSPAVGWVEALRRMGDTLWAKVRQVAPELRQAVREGRFKKISMAIYRALEGVSGPYLRHVGFLGAEIPAVKGMTPIRWSEGQFEQHDLDMPIAEALDRQAAVMRVLDGCYLLMDRVHGILSDDAIADKKTTILDQVDSLRSLVEAEMFVENPKSEIRNPKSEDPPLPAPPPRRGEGTGGGEQRGGKTMTFWQKLQALFAEAGFQPGGASSPEGVKIPGEESPESKGEGRAATFTEAQVLEREAAAAARARADAERHALSAMRSAEVKAKVTVFVEGGIKAGTFLPAWKEQGIPAVLEQLLLQDPMEFAEGKKQNPGEILLAFFGELPKVVTLQEIAGRKKDDPALGAGSAGEKLDALVRKHMQDQKVNYNVAFVEIQKAHPDLAREYAEEARPTR
jgi:hypothetical protein